MISSRLWRILVTFHQCGTLSAASDRLFVSQPSLSSAMKQLEKELGVTLFERSKNRIVLNELGLEAVQFAQSYLKQEQELIDRLQKMSWRAQTVTVASCVTGLRSELVDRLSHIYAGKHIKSAQISSELLPHGLLQEEFDYVITEYPIEEPEGICVPYVTDGLMIRLSKNDELAHHAFLTLEDLKQSNLLVLDDNGFWADYIRRQFGERMHLVFVKDEEEYYSLLHAFHIRSFILRTSVSHRKKEDEYCYVPFNEEGSQVTFYLCCLKKNAAYIPQLIDQAWDQEYRQSRG